MSVGNKFTPDARLNQKVSLVEGDITSLKFDSIVSSAYAGEVPLVLPYMFDEFKNFETDHVADRILAVAGKDLIPQLRFWCEVGDAYTTPGFNLPAKHIIHVNIPEYNTAKPQKCAKLLSVSVVSCLNTMKEHGLRSMALPCLGTGGRGFPEEMAAVITLQTVRKWLLQEDNLWKVARIAFCVYEKSSINWELYNKLMPMVFPIDDFSVASLLPREIIQLDQQSVERFRRALAEKSVKVFDVRINVVGPYGAGKTTLVKRLLNDDVEIEQKDPTEGIDLHVRRCRISLKDGNWYYGRKGILTRLASVLTTSPGADQNICADSSFGYSGPFFPVQATISSTEERVSDTRNNEARSTTFSKTHESSRPNTDSDTIQSYMDDIDALIHEAGATNIEEGLDVADVSIWDFAGEYIFYATNQVFLSPDAIYLQVVDLTKQLDDIADDSLRDSGMKPPTIQDILEYWLKAVHSFALEQTGTSASFPRVIFVGTHAGELPKDQKETHVGKFFEEIRERMADKRFRFHIVEKEFSLDNATKDPVLKELKQKIFEEAKTNPNWGKEIPAKWLPLEKAILHRKGKGKMVLTVDEIKEINNQRDKRIDSHDELILFLQYQFNCYNFIYFNEPGLCDAVILDPQWLVNALNSVILSKQFCLRNPKVSDKWRNFCLKGILHDDLLDAVWSQNEYSEFKTHKDYLMEVMLRLGMIAKTPRRNAEDKRCTFLIPSMLRDLPPDNLIQMDNKNSHSTSTLCFVFEGPFVPPTAFSCLVAACANEWLGAKQNQEEVIFRGFAGFELDKRRPGLFRMYLCLNGHAIEVTLSKLGNQIQESEWVICKHVREFTTKAVEDATKPFSDTIPFDICIKCPDVPKDSNTGYIAVGLLKESEKVPCTSHLVSHVINSRDALQSWFPDIYAGSATSSKVLSNQPCDKDIMHIAQNIGFQYLPLAIELGISDSKIQQIRMDHPMSVAHQLYYILRTWRQQEGSRATLGVLEAAMKQARIDPKEAMGSLFPE